MRVLVGFQALYRTWRPSDLFTGPHGQVTLADDNRDLLLYLSGLGLRHVIQYDVCLHR